MRRYYTYPEMAEPEALELEMRVHASTETQRRAREAVEPALRRPCVAIVTQGVKLGDETRGYTRFRFLAELLAREGFDVELITSTFQHWDKAQRDTTRACYKGLPYKVHFVKEPGYTRNLDVKRIMSHRVFARGVRTYLEARLRSDSQAFDLIYFEIPPNDMARACAEVAARHHLPAVVDINDLWPEAMRMAFDVPVLSDVVYAPFARDAHVVYNLVDAAVGTSDEYAARPAINRSAPYIKRTVYVGNDLAAFDAGAHARAGEVIKPAGELWLTYAGTLGASYDIATLVRAAVLMQQALPNARVKVLGDGPERAQLEALATELAAPVDFIGYAPYDLMAAYLCASDATINSLVKAAPQSVVTKIGDYLAAGIPLINTGSSPEFCAKVIHDGFGINVEAENPQALAAAAVGILRNPARCAQMGARGRAIAEEQFDQPRSYQVIVDLIRDLIDGCTRK